MCGLTLKYSFLTLFSLLYFTTAEGQLFHSKLRENPFEYKRNVVWRKNFLPEKRNGIFSVLAPNNQPHLLSHPKGMIPVKPMYNNVVMINKMQQYPYQRLPRNAGRKIRNPLTVYRPNMYRNGLIFGVSPNFFWPNYIDYFKVHDHLLKKTNQSMSNTQQRPQNSISPVYNEETRLLNGNSLESTNTHVSSLSSIAINPSPTESVNIITTPEAPIRYPNDEWHMQSLKNNAIHSFFTIEDAIIPTEQRKLNSNIIMPLAYETETSKKINIVTSETPQLLNFDTISPTQLSVHNYFTEEPKDNMLFNFPTETPSLVYTTTQSQIPENFDVQSNVTVSSPQNNTEALSTTESLPISSTSSVLSTRNYSVNLRTNGGRNFTKLFPKKLIFVPTATKQTPHKSAYKSSTIRTTTYTPKSQRTIKPNKRYYKSKKNDTAAVNKNLLSTSKTLRTYNKAFNMKKPHSSPTSIIQSSLSKANTTMQSQNLSLIKSMLTTTITTTTSQTRRNKLRSNRHRIRSAATSKVSRVKQELSLVNSTIEAKEVSLTQSSKLNDNNNNVVNHTLTTLSHPIIYADENEDTNMISTSESAIMKIDNRNSQKLLNTYGAAKIGLKNRLRSKSHFSLGIYNASVTSSPNIDVPRLPIEVFFKKVRDL